MYFLFEYFRFFGNKFGGILGKFCFEIVVSYIFNIVCESEW